MIYPYIILTGKLEGKPEELDVLENVGLVGSKVL
jgi:hypothetical protein